MVWEVMNFHVLVVVRSAVVSERPLAKLCAALTSLHDVHRSWSHVHLQERVFKSSLFINRTGEVIIMSLLGSEDVSLIDVLVLLAIFTVQGEPFTAQSGSVVCPISRGTYVADFSHCFLVRNVCIPDDLLSVLEYPCVFHVVSTKRLSTSSRRPLGIWHFEHLLRASHNFKGHYNLVWVVLTSQLVLSRFLVEVARLFAVEN